MKKERIRIAVFLLLGSILPILKLTGIVNWSWWTVTAPIYGSIIFVFLVIIVGEAFGSKYDSRNSNIR